ncbi:hypothetical protein ACVWU4_000968 [Campylobacter coli]
MSKKVNEFYNVSYLDTKKEITRILKVLTNKNIMLKGVDINTYKNIRRISLNIDSIESKIFNTFGCNLTEWLNSDTTIKQVKEIITNFEQDLGSNEFMRKHIVSSVDEVVKDLGKYFNKAKDLADKIFSLKV